ncbi:MAG: OB-fold domain-containing protein [Actinobacteria bacterium]|nr:OB-fold domain-containing protein [Actinomycetota bacterium]
MSAPRPKPLPDVKAPDTAGFYEAAKRHSLVVQKCNNCGEMRFPPLPICSNCWSSDQDWAEIEPTGTVWSWVVYHRALEPSFADEIPYAVGRVKTTAGPTFTVRLNIPIEEIEIDMPVTATFKDVNDEVSLLEFSKA